MFEPDYNDLGVRPERGYEHNWHVWGILAALQVLRSDEYVSWLREHPGEVYTSNFANNRAARLELELSGVLTAINSDYSVRVFPAGFHNRKYVPWGTRGVSGIDAIAISVKVAGEDCAVD